MTGRERIRARMAHEPVDRLPLMNITMMFAAKLTGIKYGEYARDHRALAEAQLNVARTFAFDQVSTISDPAREASDLGATVEWFEDQPPAINESQALLADKSRLEKLPVLEPMDSPRMRDRIEGVRLLRQRVGDEKGVEGWVEGPIAQAADLRGVNTVMLDFYDDPEFITRLFDYVVTMELAFAKRQFEAGADWIGVGDAAASLIGPKFYYDYVLPYEQKLVSGIRAMGSQVRLHICGNTRKILKGMGQTGSAIVDLDFLAPVAEAREAMGPEQVIWGNIDPVRVLRDGTPAEVKEAIAKCHREAGANYVAAAGCEVPPDTPHENLRAITEYVQTAAA